MKGDSLVAAKEAIWNKYEYELPIPLITSRYKECFLYDTAAWGRRIMYPFINQGCNYIASTAQQQRSEVDTASGQLPILREPSPCADSIYSHWLLTPPQVLRLSIAERKL